MIKESVQKHYSLRSLPPGVRSNLMVNCGGSVDQDGGVAGNLSMKLDFQYNQSSNCIAKCILHFYI